MTDLDKKKLFDALLFVGAFLVICWSVFLINDSFDLKLRAYGNRPREFRGLIGILTSPFLHGDLKHIWSNTASFAVLATMLFYFYRKIALKVFFSLFLMAGITLWIAGGEGNHIGASGVIYGLAGFVFLSGLLNDNLKLLRVSLVVAFLYGSIVWGVLPIDPKISWEGHLTGLFSGLLLAFIFRGAAPKRRLYQYEIDELLEAEEDEKRRAEIEASVEHHTGPYRRIRYIYIKDEEKSQDNSQNTSSSSSEDQ
ncbi:MAG: rhomboid family intramembrane serine protease [Flavobacteriales bacterium]|nr:rhomboid family intramembrane serine protease [Flavobacteriales bacterium]